MSGHETSVTGQANSGESREPPVWVLVRSGEEQWHLETTSDDIAMRLIGSLSLDPRSMNELQLAGKRYFGTEDLPWKRRWPAAEAYQFEPWLLIDLEQLIVIGGNGFELPMNDAVYEVTRCDASVNSEQASADLVYVNLPPYWAVQTVPDQEPREANDYRDEEEPNRLLAYIQQKRPEVRAVLFGRALVEYIAQLAIDTVKAWKAKGKREGHRTTSSMKTRREQAIIAIHKAWLLSSREDLNGENPRRFLHGADHWIEAEMQSRSREWSRTGKAPPPVERDTFLYQFGMIGPWERMVYFDLVRDVIQKAFLFAEAHPKWTVDILADELAICRNDRLRQPYEESMPETGLDIIEAERRRMPLIFTESHILDCDCPVCQAMADQSLGIHFVMFDGFQLEVDGEFAFSNVEDYEDWELQQGLDFDEDFDDSTLDDDTSDATREPIAEKSPRTKDEAAPGWDRTFINWATLGKPQRNPTVFALALSFATAEIEMELASMGPVNDELIRRLNKTSNALRRALDASNEATIEDAHQAFIQTLNKIGNRYPALARKVADLKQVSVH